MDNYAFVIACRNTARDQTIPALSLRRRAIYQQKEHRVFCVLRRDVKEPAYTTPSTSRSALPNLLAASSHSKAFSPTVLGWEEPTDTAAPWRHASAESERAYSQRPDRRCRVVVPFSPQRCPQPPHSFRWERRTGLPFPLR